MNGLLPGSLAGLRLVASSLMTKTKEVHRRERKWARRVMFQPSRRFDIEFETVPSDEVISVGGVLYAHPETIDRISNAIAMERR